MNQAIRDRFYSQGNKKHVEYVIRTSGMNEQEAELFRMLHSGAACGDSGEMGRSP